MNTLAEWTKRVSAELELDPDTMDQTLLLDLAKEAAHNVARPAAPLTTFLVGVAVGRGVPLAEAVARVTAMATAWSGGDGLQTESNPN